MNRNLLFVSHCSCIVSHRTIESLVHTASFGFKYDGCMKIFRSCNDGSWWNSISLSTVDSFTRSWRCSWCSSDDVVHIGVDEEGIIYDFLGGGSWEVGLGGDDR